MFNRDAGGETGSEPGHYNPQAYASDTPERSPAPVDHSAANVASGRATPNMQPRSRSAAPRPTMPQPHPRCAECYCWVGGLEGPWKVTFADWRFLSMLSNWHLPIGVADRHAKRTPLQSRPRRRAAVLRLAATLCPSRCPRLLPAAPRASRRRGGRPWHPPPPRARSKLAACQWWVVFYFSPGRREGGEEGDSFSRWLKIKSKKSLSDGLLFFALRFLPFSLFDLAYAWWLNQLVQRHVPAVKVVP